MIKSNINTSSIGTDTHNDSISNVFLSNPYFSAGFGLFGVGAGLALFRRLFLVSTNYLKRRLLVSLEIPSTDKSYSWLLSYLDVIKHKNYRYFIKPNLLAVNTKFEKLNNGTVKTAFKIVPGQGKQFIRWNDYFVEIERQRDSKLMDLSSGTPYETVTLTTLSKHRHIFLQILEESMKKALQKQHGYLIIYTSYGHEWRPFGNPRNKRKLDSVVLKQGQKERILDDVTQFLKNEEWYNNRGLIIDYISLILGIPYRRGYLLYGPPGTGKSSFIQALASHLDYNICVLNLSERGLTDDRLNHLLSNTPPRCFVLLEDIDAAMIKRTSEEYSINNINNIANSIQNQHSQTRMSITMSGLLNAIDGVAASEERIIFMTTNYIEKLDTALIRPGRIDIKEKLDFVNEAQITKLFLRFYPDKQELAVKFASLLKNRNVSPANLQGHFVIHKDKPHDAVENYKLLM